MGTGDVVIWIRFGGKFDESRKYVGGEYEMLLVNNNATYVVVRKMVSELLNLDDSVQNMELSFETEHPAKPIYGVVDERTFQLYMHHAQQDAVKYSLLVTVREDLRHGQCSRQGKTEPLNMLQSYIPGPESRANVEKVANSSGGARNNALPEMFGSSDLYEMPINVQSPERTQYLATNPSPSFVHVSRDLTEEKNDRVSINSQVGQGERRAEEVCTEDGIYGQGGMLGDIEENRVFRSKKELMTCLSIMSMRKKFQYKVFKSNTSFIVVRCVHPSCSWRVRANKLIESEYWMVTKHVNKHTCPTDFKTTRRRQATSWVVGECIKRRFINPGRVFRPRDVMDDMKQRYGVELSYSTNPGSVVNLEVTDGNKFQYLFIAFAASIQGFSYCRPVISIDATHLKGKYRGVLFTAVCHDANQQIFPLAIGVGDSENDAAWTWFLKRVKDVFGENPALVIVSDRHRSIRSAVEEAFPRAFHGICIYHLLNNLKTKFKSKNKELEQHYIAAAKAYNLQEFHVLFYTLCSAVPGAKEYLESVGLDRWTRSHAPCRRYNIMTTNISESFNAVLVKVRELPITAFVNEVRLLCQRWFQQRRTKANGCSSRMSTDVENKLEQRRDRAQTMDVRF
ncbi:hypothetical protein UlMin_037411 [Ulmus minor]